MSIKTTKITKETKQNFINCHFLDVCRAAQLDYLILRQGVHVKCLVHTTRLDFQGLIFKSFKSPILGGNRWWLDARKSVPERYV